MAKPATSKEMKTLVAAGKWIWANRERIREALASEPVQQALKSPQARRVIASPSVQQLLAHPQVRTALSNPEVQRWLASAQGARPAEQPQTIIPGEYEPYTGETRRLG